MHDKKQQRVRCIIVDDEPPARDVIRRYIEQMPSMELVGEFGNAIQANQFLQKNHVDLILLDIRMPQLNGNDFVRTLRKIPKIIFTTAHKEYALEGYELDVIDYLLKPIRFDRFLKAVNKAFPPVESEGEVYKESKNELLGESFIYLRVDRKMRKVLLEDIFYIESDRDYVKVITRQATLMTKQPISAVEAMLSERQFLRIHRSYIVSLSKITSFTHELVELDKYQLPIGKLYRNVFLKLQGAPEE